MKSKRTASLINAICLGKCSCLFVGLLFSCQALAAEAMPQPADILYILSKDSAFYQGFTDSLQKHTSTGSDSSRHINSSRLISSDSNVQHEIYNGHRLVVSVGSEALKVVSESGYEGPLFSVLSPDAAFKQYRRSEKYSALYASHPVGLYLRLIKIAMPKSNRVGVLLGPSSSRYEDELEDTAKTLGLRLYIKKTDYPRHVPRRIGHLAADVDVLLAIPDPAVHNPRTAQSILFAGFRHNIPVVAYSSAYLKAGALISLYTSPEQLAEDAARHIISRLESAPLRKTLSPYPTSFSIGINRNVARSLGHDGLDEAILKNLLISERQTKP